MRTSDHAALAKPDWWDILDEFTQQLTDKRWDRFNSKGVCKSIRDDVVKTMSLVQKAVHEEPVYEGNVVDDRLPTNILTVLPDDLLGVIGQQLLKAAEGQFATKIQALYRGWYQRFWSESRQWGNPTYHGDPAHQYKTLEEAQAQNLWTVCEDCGTRRAVRDVYVEDACADHQGCCKKVVCSSWCLYQCIGTITTEDDMVQDCCGPLYINRWDKRCNGEQGEFECSRCGTLNTIHERWYGITDAQNDQRYG
jgi:hypothetical protein